MHVGPSCYLGLQGVAVVRDRYGLALKRFEYYFTLDDYAAYEERRDALLLERSHVALGCGGVIWRHTLNLVRLDTLEFGPPEPASRGQTVEFPDNTFGIAEELSANELDIIAGMYRVLNSTCMLVLIFIMLNCLW